MGGRSRQGYNEMNTALVGGFFHLAYFKEVQLYIIQEGLSEASQGVQLLI